MRGQTTNTCRPAAISSPARPAPGVLRSIVRTHRRTLALILPLATVSEGVEMLMPIVLGLLIDHGILAGDLRLTVLGAAGLILLAAGLAAAASAQERPGFKDTPTLPDGRWRVHDADRPAPAIVTFDFVIARLSLNVPGGNAIVPPDVPSAA